MSSSNLASPLELKSAEADVEITPQSPYSANHSHEDITLPPEPETKPEHSALIPDNHQWLKGRDLIIVHSAMLLAFVPGPPSILVTNH